ncbi:MAG: hypothetical protein A2X56_02760 [Nitrospirae bacterium GWC2_57_13]|nr:MAG: hypothetical protein A2X56_02760 [Nitrospirae bacterium GWC2_57_13]OGW40683.1 MAG: hypothetical protein A2X57_03725 [Nitrospirae bacterium GWD2_57_8]
MKETIFGLRFSANESIQPTNEELRLFLEGPRADGKSGCHRDDLAAFDGLLQRIETFEQKHGQVVDQPGWQERKLLGVLAHSRFFRPSFRAAVEQFKYQAHALENIDLRKPTAFIRSAEEEIAKLNPKKDEAKMARLKELVEQRNRDLDGLRKRWPLLVKELNDISLYIRDGLAKITNLCEAAITTLVSLQVKGEKKDELVEDLKRHYRDRVRDDLQVGPVTKEYLAQLQGEVAALSQQLSSGVLQDFYFMTELYEQIHEHVNQSSARIEKLNSRIAAGKRQDLEADKRMIRELNGVIAALVSPLPFESGGGTAEPAEQQEKILFEKRREMVDHVFDVLKKSVVPPAK